MIKFVNAKLNLGLSVVRKREDGYHDLETVFYPVGKHNGTPENPTPFCDILEIEPLSFASDNLFELQGENISGDPKDNLVVRALDKFRKTYELSGSKLLPMRIMLEKHLPSGAGLGGGSADAAFTLAALNEICGNRFSNRELIEMAGTLGADCPFFIENRPIFASGIGDKFEEVELDLSGWWALIVRPDIFVSTKTAFSGIKPMDARFDLRNIGTLAVEEWRNRVYNDFEDSIFPLYPELKEIKDTLYKNGAKYASMSGSGSTLYGLFLSETEAILASGVFEMPCYICKL